jgi:hypothetical protein
MGGETYRLRSLVAALLLEGFLIQPGKVTMPAQEAAAVVDLHGLVDVHGNEVVEAALGSRGFRRWRVGRLRLQALDGVDVILLLLLAQRAPVDRKKVPC